MISYQPHIKRFLDFILGSAAFFFFSPLLVFLTILICIDSEGPPFFIQKRIGRELIPFRLFKFRSMSQRSEERLSEFDPGDTKRITRVGHFLRKTKMDELPQLLNVIKGDMSICGPRPEVNEYVGLYQNDFKIILKYRPGLTDLASIKYRNEAVTLANVDNPKDYYIKVILPDKIFLAKKYTKNISWKLDEYLIKKTLNSLLKTQDD